MSNREPRVYPHSLPYIYIGSGKALYSTHKGINSAMNQLYTPEMCHCKGFSASRVEKYRFDAQIVAYKAQFIPNLLTNYSYQYIIYRNSN
jgi:hypothetical protein